MSTPSNNTIYTPFDVQTLIIAFVTKEKCDNCKNDIEVQEKRDRKLTFCICCAKSICHTFSGIRLSHVQSTVCTGVMNVVLATKMENMCARIVLNEDNDIINEILLTNVSIILCKFS